MNYYQAIINELNFIIIWDEQFPVGLFGGKIDRINIPFDIKNKESGYNSIIILAELKGHGKKHAEFFGFDIALEIRTRYEILLPVIMVSFLPGSFFSGDQRFNFLKARGTSFIQLPFELDEVLEVANRIRPLTAAVLADISFLLLNPRQLIDRFTHDIRFDQKKNIVYEKARGIISDLSDELIKMHPWDELIKGLSDENISSEEFYLRKKEIILRLNAVLVPDFKGRERATNYRILLLEDNLQDSLIIQDALQPYYEITHVTHGKDAVRIIQQDESNVYHALICDWRLLENGSDHQQDWQGYEVMEYAGTRRFYALFSLTSLDDDSRKIITPYISCSFTPLTKDFEKGSNLWSLYIPIINQRIEENLFIIAGLPTGEGWYRQEKADYKYDKKGIKQITKKGFASYHQQYIEKRNNLAFPLWNHEISDLSTRMWKYYQSALSPDSNRGLQDVSTKWGIELNRDLKNVLVLRRVYLAFWYSQSRLEISFRFTSKREYQVIENPVINIYSVLRNKYWCDLLEGASAEDEAYKKLLSAAKAFVSQLALEPKSLPAGILPEEKAWLQSIGIDSEKGNDVDYYSDDNE